MSRQNLIRAREHEYSVLNSLRKDYRIPVDRLEDYNECVDRIRALNKQLEHTVL